jgi:lipopolysaccharide/colanic/teichoic acid biosynthesis glycosyltransferase
MEPLFARPLPLWKRAMDIFGAAFGLLLLSPVLLAVGLLIKLTSRGPVLFRQEREGLGGRRFVMFKFRSMIAAAESQRHELHAQNERDGPAFKIRNDPRTTPVGRLLRRTGLDEMPQLWNVLKGDMSLVGPRPLPVAESQACLQWQRRRLDVTPGLTCIWQARGGLHVSFDDWMLMDLEYVERSGFWIDVVLLAQTAWRAVLMRASH